MCFAWLTRTSINADAVFISPECCPGEIWEEVVTSSDKMQMEMSCTNRTIIIVMKKLILVVDKVILATVVPGTDWYGAIL